MEALARMPPRYGSELRLRVELDLGESLRRGNTDAWRVEASRAGLAGASSATIASQTASALSSSSLAITTREGAFVESVSLLEEALSLRETDGDVRLTSSVLGNLGYASCGVGGYATGCRGISASRYGSRAAASTRRSIMLTSALALLGLGDSARCRFRVPSRDRELDSSPASSSSTVADALVGAAAVAVESGCSAGVARHPRSRRVTCAAEL